MFHESVVADGKLNYFNKLPFANKEFLNKIELLHKHSKNVLVVNGNNLEKELPRILNFLGMKILFKNKYNSK